MDPFINRTNLDFIKTHYLPNRGKLIYKFRPIGGGHLESIIRECSLYFSSPSSWNDPFDGQLRIDTSNTVDEVRQWFREHAEGIAPDRVGMLTEKAIANPVVWEELLHQSLKEVMGVVGMCCFTSGWSSILQWAYYAGGHTGVALGFDMREDDDLFAMAMKVDYVAEYPHINHMRDPFATLGALLRAKSSEWKHEEEVRVWKNPPGLKAFRPEALREIVFGARCDSKQIDEVKSWCVGRGLDHVHFFKVRTAERAFALERAPF